jgi:uncharacterized protein YkwD
MLRKPAILALWLTAVPLVMLAIFPQQAAAGQTAGIAGPSQTNADQTPTNLQPDAAIPGPGYVYTVRPGDDLWIVAVSHGLAMEELAAENRIESPYLIHPGDKLWVVADPAPVPQDSQTEPDTTPEEAPAIAEQSAPEAPAASEPVQEPPPTSSPATEAPHATSATPVPSISSETEDWDVAIIGLMNQRRAEFGLAPLSWSLELDQAAQTHAEDLARRGWGGHVGSDGAVLRTRLIRAGYPVSWAGENWANARNLQHAFDMWWYEPPGADPHRQNILGSSYREIGIGIAKGGWGYYFVANFASR